ncbi:MAG: hypothetical protein Fur0018_08370 [Anaerolineales bacterium]
MNTPSHLIITAALHKKAARTDIPRSAVLWGSVMPDVPLGILSLAVSLYYRFILRQNPADVMETVFHQAYFHNPWWIAAHNFLHSPLALELYLAVLWRYRRQPGGRGHWALWFVADCLLHTALDIPVHFDDGPLLFWPLNWQTRFHSPVSYWDPAHYGLPFSIFEGLLDIALLGWMLLPEIKKRLQR